VQLAITTLINFACGVDWFQLNLVFLCNIMRILLFQLHAHPQEPSSFRYDFKDNSCNKNPNCR